MEFTLAVLALVFLLLAFSHWSSDLILIGAVLLLLLGGVITTGDALNGLAKPDLVAVALLYIVGAGMADTGAMAMLAERMLGKPKSPQDAVIRLMIPVAICSAFMNNTPLVAMMIPVTADWAKKYGVPVSKLMMPLSFASILGGCCTKIGTSTNLVVSGLMQDYVAKLPAGHQHLGHLEPTLGFLDVTWVGVPVALAGILFL